MAIHRHLWLSIVILLLLVGLPYAPSLNFGFVYDDHGSIAENPFLQQPANLGRVLTLRTLTDPHVLDGQRPVVLISYFLDRALWGIHPFGYHLTNLFLHLLVVICAFFLVRRLADSHALALLASLLYGLHPVLTEAVHLPAYREDLLCAFFGVAFLLLSLTGKRMVWAGIALVLALGSKESATLPLLLAWTWLCLPAQRPARKRMIDLMVVSLFLVGVYLLLCFQARPFQAVSGIWNGLSLKFPENLFSVPWLWQLGVQLLVWPHPLLADYVITPVLFPLYASFVVGAGTLLVWLDAIWLLRRRMPVAAWGMGWMLIAFLPVSNIIPLFNPFAERYLYFVAIGFALALGTLLVRLPKPWMTILVLMVGLLYGAMTWTRLRDWKDDRTLWTATLSVEPRSARAHTWLGIDSKQRGELDAAREHFAQADRLNPQDVSALINLAILDGQADNLTNAEARLREAVRRRPDKADAHWNLAVVLRLQGRDSDAEEEIRSTLRLDPSHPQARSVSE